MFTVILLTVLLVPVMVTGGRVSVTHDSTMLKVEVCIYHNFKLILIYFIQHEELKMGTCMCIMCNARYICVYTQ